MLHLMKNLKNWSEFGKGINILTMVATRFHFHFSFFTLLSLFIFPYIYIPVARLNAIFLVSRFNALLFSNFEILFYYTKIGKMLNKQNIQKNRRKFMHNCWLRIAGMNSNILNSLCIVVIKLLYFSSK